MIGVIDGTAGGDILSLIKDPDEGNTVSVTVVADEGGVLDAVER